MAREPYDDNDYQLNEEDAIYEPEDDSAEHGSEHDVAPEQYSAPKKSFGKKIIIFLIVIVLAGLIIYKLGSWFLSSPKTAVKQKATTSLNALMEQSKTSTIANEETKTLPTLPAATQPDQKQTELAPAKSGADTIAKLQQADAQVMASLRQQQDENKTNLMNLQNRLGGLEEGISNLQNSLEGLTTTIQHQRAAEKAQRVYQAKVKAKQERVMREHKQFFVKAVIPGRAWLVGADGTAVTVAVGDVLPGYGEVTAIDSYSGTVTTQLGGKIRYGSNSF